MVSLSLAGVEPNEPQQAGSSQWCLEPALAASRDPGWDEVGNDESGREERWETGTPPGSLVRQWQAGYGDECPGKACGYQGKDDAAAQREHEDERGAQDGVLPARAG